MEKVRITKFKKFVKDNKIEDLYFQDVHHFDAMIDGTSDGDRAFKKAVEAYRPSTNNLGIAGVWIVGGSRDYITEYEDDFYIGFDVYNACGNWILAKRK